MKTIILFITSIVMNVHCTPVGDLYRPEDDVEILNIENFKSIVEHSKNAWVVEFYAAWCGHCQRFSEPWKRFASDIASWRDMVRVGVLACSDEINIPICMEFEITGYPTVRYFREQYEASTDDLGDEMPYSSDNTREEIKNSLIEKFITEINEGRGVMYPNLLTYVHSDVTELFSGKNDDVQFAFLTVEEPGGHLGAEVALDLHRTPNITIRYSFNNNAPLINNLQLQSFPSLVVVDRKNNIEIFAKTPTTKSELKNAVGRYLQEKKMKIVEITPNKLQNSSSESNHRDTEVATALRLQIKNMGDVIFQADLEAALRYSLQQEVATVKLIKGENLEALNTYVRVIKKYFPFDYNGNYFIDKLSNITSNSEQVQSTQIELLVKEAEKNGTFSSAKTFLGCLGSSSRYRGYPCGLWRLFHFLTVNSYLFNGNKPEADPTEVLVAMRSYIKSFFSCTHCSQHFLKMAAERNLSNVKTLQESVFWLWEAHNVVNVRLKGDSTEDPEYPKNLFPTKLNCPECYAENGLWAKNEVLKYLIRMYARYNVNYIGSDTETLFPGLD